MNNPLESKLGTIAVEFKRLKWTKRLYRDSEDEIDSDSASDGSTSPSPNLTDGQEQSGSSSKKRACPREKVLVNEKSKKAAISSVTLYVFRSHRERSCPQLTQRAACQRFILDPVAPRLRLMLPVPR